MSTDYTEFFLSTAPTVYRIETVELSHPNFSQTYYLQADVTEAVTLTLEDYSDQEFQYYPLRLRRLKASNDLDAGIEVTLGDLGEVLPLELDNVIQGDGFETKPTMKYRLYRSDDTTAPMLGPETYEITEFNFARDGSSFQAQARALNLNRTGEIYTIERFPMLKGFI